MRIVCYVAVLIGSVAGLAYATNYLYDHYRHTHVNLPTFPPTENNEPQVLVELEPDFSHRTGDHIPIVIYIKQFKNVIVDVKSLVLEGDFEIAKEYPVEKFENEIDGSTCYKIPVVLQSLFTDNKLVSQLSFTYRLAGERHHQLVHLPIIELYTSFTWDGRKELKEEPFVPETGNHWWWTLGTLTYGVIGLITTGIVAIVRKRRERRHSQSLSKVKLATAKFNAVWAKIEANDYSVDNYRQIEQIVRDFCGAHSQTLTELLEGTYVYMRREHLRQVVRLCQDAIYVPRQLTPEENQQLHASVLAVFKEVVI
jgi:hypothetical protein